MIWRTDHSNLLWTFSPNFVVVHQCTIYNCLKWCLPLQRYIDHFFHHMFLSSVSITVPTGMQRWYVYSFLGSRLAALTLKKANKPNLVLVHKKVDLEVNASEGWLGMSKINIVNKLRLPDWTKNAVLAGWVGFVVVPLDCPLHIHKGRRR